MARAPKNASLLTAPATATEQMQIRDTANPVLGAGYVVGYRLGGTGGGTFKLRADSGAGAELFDGVVGLETQPPFLMLPTELWQPFASGFHVTITGGANLVVLYRLEGQQ